MDPIPTQEQPATSSAMATPPTHQEQPTKNERPSSPASINSVVSSQSHQEYLDSLVVPTKEQFARIADVQAEREAEQKRLQREKQRQSIDAALRPATASNPSQTQQPHHVSLFSRFGSGHRTTSAAEDDSLRAKAATVIQRTYRGYRVRREMKGLGIDASTRWIHAVREAQWREMTTPRARAALSDDGLSSPGQPGTRASTARQNWKKVSTIARHAGGDVDADDSSSTSSSSSSSDSDSDSDEKKKQKRKRKEEAKARRKQEARMMGLQYFLEMVDLKHRYGANLLVYHEVWKSAETNENFFYWLDHGEGKDVDLAACPRERLDREQVRYLSREERQYYLVNVDDEGRLCWAKNGARIDTTTKYKDSIHGIVPSDDPTPAYAPVSENRTALLGDTTTDSGSSRPSSSSSSNSSITSANAARYANPPTTSTTKKLSHHFSGTTIINKLLRKTVRKNTWIFVADTSFRLYVGIKNSGAFQHSSFLQGSRISAAGLIRIRDGRLTSLSPLSGHYRPPASNFRAFLKSLKDAGVDMSRVSVSKSYAVLAGLEMYVKVRRKAGDVVGKVTRRGKKKGAELVVPEPEGKHHPSTAGKEKKEKKEGVIEPVPGAAASTEHGKQQKQEEKMRKENEIAVRVLGGAGVAEPKGQKGGGDGEEGEATALRQVSNPQSAS